MLGINCYSSPFPSHYIPSNNFLLSHESQLISRPSPSSISLTGVVRRGFSYIYSSKICCCRCFHQGASVVVLLMRNNVKRSASMFSCNLRQIRHWLVEESVGTTTMCTGSTLRKLKPASLCCISSFSSSSSPFLFQPLKFSPSASKFSSRMFGSSPLDETLGPAPIDYGSLLQEDDFHRLADATIEDLQEKFEEYGDDVQIDGFDIDYGNQVLTLKLGSLGTYVMNKQTPNRQIWLSSPVSGPSRFDWDRDSKAWVYRRTKEKLLQLLESEVEQLCGKPVCLS